MASRITSPDALRVAAVQNKGIFDATVARAPSNITFKGKTYPRAAAKSVEQKLWYLGATAMTQPQAVAGLANVAFSLDEVYGLDPDRSRIDAAESALREAKAKERAAQGRLNGLRAQLRVFEQNLTRALAAQKEAQKVQIGDIFTAGISAAGRNLYADGQVQIWKDRIESLKTGSLVGMAGQEGFQVPLNDGIAQNEAKLAEARAAVQSATAELADAQRAYDAEAAANRREEERQRAEAARAERERQRAEAEARAREEAAARDAAAAEQARQTSVAASSVSSDTDPTAYVTDDGEVYDPTAYDPEDPGEWLEGDLAADVAGDEDFVGEQFGADDDGQDVPTYVSPYDFDRYYACDACRAGEQGDDCEGGCSRSAMIRSDAMGLDGEGYGFDPNIIVIILSAILALAPAIISMFSPPPALEDGNAPPSGAGNIADALAGLTGQPTREQQLAAQKEAEQQKQMETVGWGLAAFAAFKLLA